MTVIAFLVGVALLVVGLAVSIALHEVGHLVPAKLFGVRVGQYMVGFGPTLWSTRIGETEYGVKAIPLGGYISMAGMYPPSPEEEAGTKPRRTGRLFRTMIQDARDANAETMIATGDRHTFYRLPVVKRVIVMLGGPVMNLLLAVVLFAIVFSGFGVQIASTTVASVNECVLPADAGRTDCAADDPAAPANEAGIEPGDVLVSVDGTAVSTFDEASAIIQDSPGRSIPVVVERDGREQTLTMTPTLATRDVVTDDGATETREVGFAGITAQVTQEQQPLWAGPEAAVDTVGRVAGTLVQLPVLIYETAVDLFTGQERDPNGPMSVVGAGRLAGDIAVVDAPIENRAAAIVSLLASLNVMLFVFNLIPLLPLDGGHVVVALWDGIKRAWAKLFGRREARPVDATKLVPVTFVVVVLLVGMGGILILADLFNPIVLF